MTRPGTNIGGATKAGEAAAIALAALIAAALAVPAAAAVPPARPLAVPSAPAPRPKAEDRAPVVALRVIDGDTFALGDGPGAEVVRLSDIDTPEIRGKCQAERLLARLATRRLADELAAPGWLLVRTGRRDRHGRTIALVLRPIPSAEGVALVSIGAVMVAEGYAALWTGRRNDWCGRSK